MLQAPIHAIWLAPTGLSLGSSITDVVDTSQSNFPLREHVQHYYSVNPDFKT
jgi:hypothetical protein